MPGRLPPLQLVDPICAGQMADTSIILIRGSEVEVVIPHDAEEMLIKALVGADTPSQSR